MRDEKQLVLDFMKSHKLAVLATASSDAILKASVVGISVMDNKEVLFGAFYRIKPKSIKYSDHSQDPADVIKLTF